MNDGVMAASLLFCGAVLQTDREQKNKRQNGEHGSNAAAETMRSWDGTSQHNC